MIDFTLAKLRILKNFKDQIRVLDYWENIYKKFKRLKAKGVEEFTLQFKHDALDPVIPDNESKIEAYANDVGYEIVDEKLCSNVSIYTFKIKKER